MLYSNECNCYTYNFILWRFYNPECDSDRKFYSLVRCSYGRHSFGYSLSAANFIIVPSETTHTGQKVLSAVQALRHFLIPVRHRRLLTHPNVASITVDVAGAEGMLNLGSGSTPGYGGRVQCTIPYFREVLSSERWRRRYCF